ncbi:MAG: Outer membrane receptor proteins, mostly Fe transport [uncultured Thiotrichaceae bacterium]|uniref:Outer membrane receptor proteins, mostly Fe transport n=1 Tax=uncultured Thiotrichaceae bacterium TaxID=298394 RepID=A0A6S6U3H8_9GAMM|nr:MAG: Outer membrane receptor proteins, mostly Fe transport [uncultured Thiotrichaceae bacterium]
MGYQKTYISYLALAASMSGLSAIAIAEDELDAIDVVAPTPLHGVELPKDQIPVNVQTATADDIEKSQSVDLTDFMNKQLGSVTINSAQNNPFQPDIQYRGFSASPLLGLPQGMSAHMDGVRLNAPFGDNIHWDTIPMSAISSINLMPGSNPLFGLNTLGGALSLQTKNGFTHPGHSIQAYSGSFNRHALEFESGGNTGENSYFVTGNWLREDGWRDHSESEVKQLFANVGKKTDSTTVDLSLSLADTDLNGNGSAPVELIEIDREAVFTWPDNTQNDSQLLNLRGSHWLNDDLMLSGNVFYRNSDTNTFNGDGLPYEEADEDAGDERLVNDDGDFVQDQFGNILEGDDFSGVNNRGVLEEESGGFNAQMTFLKDLGEKENQLVVGVGLDRGDSSFKSSVEVVELTDDRGTTQTGIFVPDDEVSVTSKNRNYSVFFTDTVTVTDKLSATLSGRYNNTEIKVRDKLDATSTINADHGFNRFNPAAGLTYQTTDSSNVYLNYSESSRAPTPSELGCSDPDDPCTLPNAFLADPPLDQVVSKSIEAGIRGKLGSNVSWNAGIYNATNEDDIIFISTGGTTGNAGYFDNVGDTRRQGLELGLTGKADKLSFGVNYSYVDAEFKTPLTISSPNHPLADGNGDISVQSGDKIPSIPAHNLKLTTNYAVSPKLSIGGNAIYNSGQYYRGDEANLLGKIDGYSVVNLRADYKINPKVKLFTKVDNVFDEEYSSFGLLGEPDEVFDGSGVGSSPAMDNPRFEGAGAPRAAWLGVKVSL